jgi:hypothetical protein
LVEIIIIQKLFLLNNYLLQALFASSFHSSAKTNKISDEAQKAYDQLHKDVKKAERDGTLYQTQQKEVKAVFDKIKNVLAAVSNMRIFSATVINLGPIISRGPICPMQQ